MLLTVPCGILILGKIARGMFCIIKSNCIVSCNSFLIIRQKLGDYLNWIDVFIETLLLLLISSYLCLGFSNASIIKRIPIHAAVAAP